MAIVLGKSNLQTSSSLSSSLELLEIPEVKDSGVLTLESVFESKIETNNTLISIHIGSLEIDWQSGAEYSIEFSPGFFVDENGLESQSQSSTLQTPSTGPILQSAYARNNDSVTLAFDRDVYPSSGTILVYKSDNTLIATINSTTGNPGADGSITYKGVLGLLTPNTSYYITATAGIVYDDFLGDSSAITAGQATFTTVSEPLFHDLSADMASNITVEANVMKYHGLANMTAEASLSAVIGKIIHYSADLSLNATMVPTPNDLRFQINVPTDNYEYKFTIHPDTQKQSTFIVYWGDNSSSTYTNAIGSLVSATHTYTSSGYYDVMVISHNQTISGLGSTSDSRIMTQLYDWGTSWISDYGGMISTFRYQSYLLDVPPYLPTFRNPSFDYMFSGCTNFNSPNIRSWFTKKGSTVTGSPIFTSVNKFGTHSLGTGSITTEPMNFGLQQPSEGTYNDDYSSIEFWYRPSSTTGSQDLVKTSNNLLSIKFNAGKIQAISHDIILATSGSLSLNTWYHIAFLQSGGHRALFVNGTRVGYNNSTSNYYSSHGFTSLVINSGAVGYIDELRVSNHRYNSSEISINTSITVPTAAYSNDNLTMLLLHFNNNITDYSSWDGMTPGVGSAIRMFENCTSFNQDLTSWNVPSIITSTNFDENTTSWTAGKPNFGYAAP